MRFTALHWSCCWSGIWNLRNQSWPKRIVAVVFLHTNDNKNPALCQQRYRSAILSSAAGHWCLGHACWKRYPVNTYNGILVFCSSNRKKIYIFLRKKNRIEFSPWKNIHTTINEKMVNYWVWWVPAFGVCSVIQYKEREKHTNRTLAADEPESNAWNFFPFHDF